MKTAIRIVVALGVLGGIAWLLFRFGPEMMNRCQSMMNDQVEPSSETAPDQVAEQSDELVEAQA